MKVQSLKLKVLRANIFFVFFFLLFTACCLFPAFVHGEGKWKGIDESVVEEIAKAHGREPREPFINADQGDLLLFVFLLAGAVAGFAAGYFWRKLIEQEQKGPQ